MRIKTIILTLVVLAIVVNSSGGAEVSEPEQRVGSQGGNMPASQPQMVPTANTQEEGKGTYHRQCFGYRKDYTTGEKKWVAFNCDQNSRKQNLTWAKPGVGKPFKEGRLISEGEMENVDPKNEKLRWKFSKKYCGHLKVKKTETNNIGYPQITQTYMHEEPKGYAWIEGLCMAAFATFDDQDLANAESFCHADDIVKVGKGVPFESTTGIYFQKVSSTIPPNVRMGNTINMIYCITSPKGHPGVTDKVDCSKPEAGDNTEGVKYVKGWDFDQGRPWCFADVKKPQTPETPVAHPCGDGASERRSEYPLIGNAGPVCGFYPKTDLDKDYCGEEKAKKGYYVMRKSENKVVQWLGCMKPLRDEDDENTLCEENEMIFFHQPSQFKGCMRSTKFREQSCKTGYTALTPERTGKYNCYQRVKPQVNEGKCKNGLYYLDPSDPEQAESPFAGSCMQLARSDDQYNEKCWESKAEELKKIGVEEEDVKYKAEHQACFFTRDKRIQKPCPDGMFDPEEKEEGKEGNSNTPMPQNHGQIIYSGICVWMPNGQLPGQGPTPTPTQGQPGQQATGGPGQIDPNMMNAGQNMMNDMMNGQGGMGHTEGPTTDSRPPSTHSTDGQMPSGGAQQGMPNTQGDPRSTTPTGASGHF